MAINLANLVRNARLAAWHCLLAVRTLRSLYQRPGQINLIHKSLDQAQRLRLTASRQLNHQDLLRGMGLAEIQPQLNFNWAWDQQLNGSFHENDSNRYHLPGLGEHLLQFKGSLGHLKDKRGGLSGWFSLQGISNYFGGLRLKTVRGVKMRLLQDWEPEFDMDEFLEGAKHAVDLVMELFDRKDAETLKLIMTPKLQAICAETFAEFNKRDTSLMHQHSKVKSCELDEMQLDHNEDDSVVLRLVVSCQVEYTFEDESVSERPYKFTHVFMEFERLVNQYHPDDEQREKFEYRWWITQIH